MTEKIFFIGGGAIATAIGNVLAAEEDTNVTLLTIEQEAVENINTRHINEKYFPNIRLQEHLKASTDFGLLQQKALVFIAIPSVSVVDFIHSHTIHSESALINLAKGFGNENRTIVEYLADELPNPVATMKGPSFAREILNSQPTAFTIGTQNKTLYQQLKKLFSHTTIHTDHSTDIRGTEMLSILKNIYAIVIGVVDAQFESPNLKFMIFTKAFKEMRRILLLFGGIEETLFNYCGIGDYALTSLNDLSRNRTLGLLIGKGFFTDYISEKVVLEGRIACNVFYEELVKRDISPSDFPIFDELHQVFNSEYDISRFVSKLLHRV